MVGLSKIGNHPIYILNARFTFKSKIDRINSDKDKVKTLIFTRSRAANSVVSLHIFTIFEVIQALMYSYVLIKYHEDPIINGRQKMETPFSSL